MTNDDLLSLWQIGVHAVGGAEAVEKALRKYTVPKPDRIIAVGKAASAMSQSACKIWPETKCLIITKYGHGDEAPAKAQLLESAHPVPDQASLKAGQALQKAVASCSSQDHLLILASGGASALAEVPIEGVDIVQLQNQTNALLASGADIRTMNLHRTQNSQIKGGKLLCAFKGSHVTTLAISDVEGDALATIGSGFADVPQKASFSFTAHIVASNAIARAAVAAASPVPVRSNYENLYDNVLELAPRIAAKLKNARSGLYIMGGEPVIHLPKNPGLGGRNMALALNLAREISNIRGLRILVAGSDGTDGPTDAAGAIVDGNTWRPEAQLALDTANAYPWLKAHGALITTGPTGTNVMDILIAHKS